MPFVIEQVAEPKIEQVEGNKTDVGSPLSVILISLLVIYLFRGVFFALFKLGFISLIGFGLYKFLT